ncbi:MAG: hypothetical protein N2322_06140 [Terrimicrobiaceae bacterium]|nr:hypothetical protein [Terrimicrobiaceae bacterium]
MSGVVEAAGRPGIAGLWLRAVAVGVALLAFGAARLPFEQALDAAQRAARLRATPLDLDLRERVGQLGFLAALSGFRSPLAAILWIEAHTAWERLEWGRMAGLFDTVTMLQPRSLLYWDMAAWHMAWNASVAALEDKRVQSEALRQRNQRQYFELGRDILERGLRNNPDSAFLWERLGVLLRDKFEDHCAAAEAFDKAASLPGAPAYMARFAAYELARCPGREREAYERLRRLFLEGERQRLPTLVNLLRSLENKLEIPESERVKE